MNTPLHSRGRRIQRAFTLIELIGVLAIIAIMASMVVPSALRSIERAAVRAEAETASEFGEQLKTYLKERRVLPAENVWHTEIAQYTELPQSQVLLNRRDNDRRLVYDVPPPGVPQRALLLSSMRPGLVLPSAAQVRASFNAIWNATPDDSIPATFNWAGWGAVHQSGQYLVVERLNFRSLYQEDLQTFTVTLNNVSGSTAGAGGGGGGSVAVTASYHVIYGSGTPVPGVANLPAGSTVTIPGLRSGDRVELFSASGGSSLNYSYIVNRANRSFEFDGAQWLSN